MPSTGWTRTKEDRDEDGLRGLALELYAGNGRSELRVPTEQ